MSQYTLVVFLHIAAAVLLLATSIVGEPLVRNAVRRATGVCELRAFLRLGRPMARISPIAAVLVLATGMYLTGQGGLWAIGWIQAAIAFWFVNAIVAVAVVRPAVDALAAAAETSDTQVGPHLDELRWASNWTWGQDGLAVTDAVTLAIMTLKPSLGGSLLLFLLAHTAVMGARRVFGFQRPPMAPAVASPGGTEA